MPPLPQTVPERENSADRQAVTEFLRLAAHDLKAPLRRIVQFCEMLNGNQDDLQMALERIAFNARRTQLLIDALTAYERALYAPSKKTPIDVTHTVEDALKALSPFIEKTGATVTLQHLPPSVPSVDAALIVELFKMLIDNALQYKRDAPPVIEIEGVESGAYWQFSVRDNGKGIAPEYHDKIFEPFIRLHSYDDIEGIGLGLTICRHIVAAHGGTIRVESKPDQGSTLFFTLAKA